MAPLRVANHVWQAYLKNQPGRSRYWVIPGADHYLQCDAPTELAEIVRVIAGGEDIGLQTLGNRPEGAVLVDQGD
ncbi:hydrolase domain protein [Mycobacterium kansasii 732]|nr:hydrolase domain protein [Mycobacterium kansasii 732]